MTSVPAALVTLRQITDADRDAVRALAVRDDQQRFVAANEASFRHAAAEPQSHPWFRAIHAGDTLVGFVMLADDVTPTAERPWRYMLWRLMIDARYQGRGYGRAAVERVVEYVRGRPGATELYTACVPGDGSPCPFYERLGFEATGGIVEGELVMRLPIVP
ncbi:MAG: GNAT family N-acetyltransferase [Chloroflexota bacterium]